MNELPFHDCTHSEFLHLLAATQVACQFSDLLSSPDFRKILYNYSQNDVLRSLDCNYYTAEEFNSEFARTKKYRELSVLHLNIRSLNSRLRDFCTLIKLLAIDFDIIVIS